MVRNKKNDKITEQEKIKKERRKTGFYYSFVTIILLVCFLRIGVSAIGNFTKVLAYKGKIGTLEKKLEEVKANRDDLNKEISAFSVSNVEDIGRNVFKMAKEDEIEIIINKHPEISEKKNNKGKNVR